MLAYLPAAFIVGFAADRPNTNTSCQVIAMLVACLVVYAIGVSWLKIMLGWTYAKALAVGMYPFLLGDALKIWAAVPIAKKLRPLMARGRSGAGDGRVHAG